MKTPIHKSTASHSYWFRFLAHLSTTCSRGAFRVVICSTCIVNNFFKHLPQTAGPVWTKLCKNVPWEILFKSCSQNLIPSKILVAMATKLNFLSNSLKIFYSESPGPILKSFHRNVPCVTLFKNCLQNFDPSINMALVNGGFLHYTDMKKFIKNLL